MSAKNHPDYHEELERCNYTLRYINSTLEETIVKKQNLDKQIERLKKHYNSDNSQDYIDLIINTTLQGSMDLRLRNLSAARSKPYFARIDFTEEGKSVPEKLYIGKMCLMRDEDQEMIIIDWRAPIANLYYEGRLGNTSYSCPDGEINSKLELKRQFTINDGVLEDIFDIDITTNDQLLQSCLGANADSRLKDIVSTIQADQNKIIRANMWIPLIVQGAAGSGKTTIALHRIAYLIYTYEKSFKPENFMIIAPNKLFLNYISEVLPELGVERVKQTTFEDFAMELIGKKFKIKDVNEKLVWFVEGYETNTAKTNKNVIAKEIQAEEKDDTSILNSMIYKASAFKSSLEFRDLIDKYIKQLEIKFIPKEHFKIGEKIIFQYEEIKKLFMEDYYNLPFVKRIEEIKKHLTNRLRVKKEQIINHFHEQCDTKIFHIKMSMGDTIERQNLISSIIDKKNEMIKKLETYSKKAVNEYVKKIMKVTPFEYYKKFITEDINLLCFEDSHELRQLINFISEQAKEYLKSGYIEIEDLAPIMYIKYHIYGMDEKVPVKHVVIDEAQDFSEFQLLVLKKIIKDSSFTILGDLCQGIHSYRGIKSWDSLMENVFTERKAQLLTLEQSYRTTIEIMEGANKVVSKIKSANMPLAKPVIRHGDNIELIEKGNFKEIVSDIESKIPDLKKQNYRSIAIICKSISECKTIHSFFKKGENCPHIITGKEDEYKGGIVIVPSYLSKGLEFDVVFIANASDSVYRYNDLDAKLLYVAMTRPLHKLYIYHIGKPSLLLL